jgi:hypothetical protein
LPPGPSRAGPGAFSQRRTRRKKRAASSSVYLSGGRGGRLLDAFVLAAKATIGRACEEAGHAQHHQSLALGIGADAFGGLCQLAKLPDALRSGARLRMCSVHDGEPELGRLPLLRKSPRAPTAHTVRARIISAARPQLRTELVVQMANDCHGKQARPGTAQEPQPPPAIRESPISSRMPRRMLVTAQTMNQIPDTQGSEVPLCWNGNKSKALVVRS